MSNGTNGDRLLSRRVIDLFFIFQVAINVIVLGILVTMMFVALSRINDQASRQDLILKSQIEFVQNQNDIQLCTQHDIILAIQKLGRGLERALGLPPLAHIDIPNTQGLKCDEIAGRGVNP